VNSEAVPGRADYRPCGPVVQGCPGDPVGWWQASAIPKRAADGGDS